MSGTSGSRQGGGGRVSYNEDPPCDKLRFEAQVTSPKPQVVLTLSPGDVLDVVVALMGGQAVVQVRKDGQIVGGLAGPDATRLRNCMENGHEYKATVRAINGGQVRVLVEHT